MRFTDEQRRRLAAKAKELGRKLLAQVATIVTPETLMAWHRKTHRSKVRWQFISKTRTAPNGGRNRGPGCSDGEGEFELGLPSDSRRTGQSRSFVGIQHDRQYSEATRHRGRSRTQ